MVIKFAGSSLIERDDPPNFKFVELVHVNSAVLFHVVKIIDTARTCPGLGKIYPCKKTCQSIIS